MRQSFRLLNGFFNVNFALLRLQIYVIGIENNI
jgi:hypothetical protein